MKKVTDISKSNTQIQKNSQLENKLDQLTKSLAQLEELRKKYEEEIKKTTSLTQQLENKEKREKQLLAELESGSKQKPVIVISNPHNKSIVETSIIKLSGVAEDIVGIDKIEILINDKILNFQNRSIVKVENKNNRRFEFDTRITLDDGENSIKIRAINVNGFSSEETLVVHNNKKQRKVWAVIIGIDNYPKLPNLKYAVNDAKVFHEYLTGQRHILNENIILLVNKDASLTRIRSILGTHLKNRAGKDDMVIIYFAGHGATEVDKMSPDGDGLEKYLLPYDSDPQDLYATALPMGEISRIFQRIQSERLIFIADSCYSGSSGGDGRTIGISGVRADISAAYLDRIAGGKGRVILTASGPNEVSVEKDELKHGVFTYYFIEGLKGRADMDDDGLITVDEVYHYVSTHVPQATGQEQHPVKKGTIEGQLVLGIEK